MSTEKAIPDDRKAFYDEIRPHNMAPLWEVLHALVAKEPVSPVQTVRWRYDDVRSYVMASADLITAKEAERRVLILENPGLPGQSAVTQSLYAGLQLIMPGEIAPCHRHTQCALRFVMEGDGAYTAVDGERAIMKEWDLILTPSWQWHDHGNESDGPMVWLDGLDIPTIRFFDASFAQQGNDEYQLDRRPPGDSRKRFGSNMLPVGFEAPSKSSPVFHYPYAEYREALEQMRGGTEWDPNLGLKLQFINPADGGPVMPTIAAFVQMLPKGFKTAGYKATDSMVVTVVEGTGKVAIGDVTYDLKPRDIFVIPSWHRHAFEAQDDLVLFVYSDKGMQEKLGIWNEQRDSA
ncbi:gentisate 1,2-dioxygenase [Hwanghaeella grinnelliae]|uniref:Gentisate 1,2-dioxygenase n=1 Tax=Hwanghaeella grinnelliae TaxID=2500179 RepID=A0A3S2VSY3_9PROT|nr:gentisate 1,2-dioxygenase [Hwanghaeella grinnelliae]RVU39097.1 gentisate 1,2-dioxygenase [Hwanghaeella grinnelliae]